ncbi:hypothetical protein MATL_G00209520 [Megalops atlanticus]|uniref:Uncharacterized protein n=1 Tax=Megalops atlanticus TaxID=7932 RepID=A0A9D3PI96_MEGAT|nr:hypothetical protein MATL_G00209520 [Megalops atlanticus]
MLVQVEFRGVQKWVRVPVTDDCYDYFKFIQEVSAKFNLPNGTDVDLKDSAGVDVAADVFDELLRSSTVSFMVFTEHSAESEVSEVSFCSDEGSFSPVESVRSSSSLESVSSTASSASTVITESTKAWRRKLVEGPPDSKVAKDLVYVSLHQKPGGEDVFMYGGYVAQRLYVRPQHLNSCQIDQDFTMLFGEDISGKFIEKWPTFYKPRVITLCKDLRPGTHLDDLLSALEESNDYGWDSDLAAILLLVHLLPPTTKGKRHGKFSASEAADHVFKFMKPSILGGDKHGDIP